MPEALPARPNLEWLKKTAKQKLKSMRARDSKAKLADAQLAVARDYGFASWRKLKSHVDEIASRPAAAGLTPQPSAPPQLTGEQIVGAFLKLVGTGRIKEVRAILAAAPQLVNAVGPHPFWGGRPQALHVSIETKRPDLFDLLLERGADVNGSNDQYDHWSPLMLTVNWKQPEMRAELLRRGATVGLLEALMFGDDALVEKILRPGKLPSIMPNAGSILAFARTPVAIDRLLELGAPRDTKDRWGATPIEAMSRLGKRGQPLVRHMIERGVAAEPQEYARLGDRRALETLIKSDPRIARLDEVIKGAVDFQHHDLVEWLLARGANVNARSSHRSRETSLHSAAWNGDLQMVKLLVAAGADTNALDEQYHGTPVKWAETAIEVSNNPKCEQVVEYLSKLTGDEDQSRGG